MRIFSNFDTEFQKKIVAEKTRAFGADAIFVLTRSRFYLYFRVIAHFVWYFVVLISMIFFLNYIQAVNSIYVVLIFVWFLVVWFRVFHKFLKYMYDFTIVTPKGVTTYKQKGILHSQIKEIPSARIEAIQTSRDWILGNIFSYWCVDIIANTGENSHLGQDDEAPWVTGLTYVDHPFEIKTQISNCCFK